MTTGQAAHAELVALHKRMNDHVRYLRGLSESGDCGGWLAQHVINFESDLDAIPAIIAHERDEVATLRAERDDALAKLKDRDDNDAWWREQRDMWGEQLKDADEQITALRARVQQLEQALREVERNCPCGARPECLDRYPHVISCPVAAALSLLDRP